LKSAKHPLSVPAIVSGLSGKLDEVNVYRALEALTKAHILSRSDLRRGGAHYELAHGHHHHVICNDCGMTEDVRECADKNLEIRVLRSAKGFATINTHALEFFGTCNSCSEI
jgi:Fur family ferric uptake transcriptional regulator